MENIENKQNLSNELLESLSEEERAVAFSILKEMQSEGTSNTYNNLVLADYNEVPVDMYTFLHNKRYLGKGLTDAEGRFTVFPYWEDLLIKLYPDPLEPAKCNTLALTGGIGLGKTLVAVIIGLYELYRILCLKDPYVYYGLQPIDKITFAFINITLDDARGVAWSKLQGLVKLSPWFLEHGKLSKSDDPEWSPDSEKTHIELICGSLPRHFIGRALKFAFMDEISFQPNQDVTKQVAKAKTLVSEASSRMKSRFMKGEHNPTILVLASSKRTEQSFMETFIADKKRTESKTTWVVDEPQWVIRTDKDTPKKFKVAIGNKFLPSEILAPDTSAQEEQYYIDRGFRLLEVPISYYEDFTDDIENALMTIAGISTTSISSYISGIKLSQCKVEDLINPFTKDVIEVGDDKDDKAQYKDFFDLDKVPKELISKPLYIHLDLSLTGDKTGIGGVWIVGKKPPQEGEPESRELTYQVAFIVSVKAPRNHQVSFEKTRNFIYWLKEQGFNIKMITSDTFARSGVEQDLISKGYNYEILSVDRCNSDHVCEPYAYFKNAIYEQRIRIPKKGTNLLTEEIIGLKRDNNSGKVDHDSSGINSKDSSDAVCGALYTASKHAEEYAYDFGEDLSVALDVSNDIGNDHEKQQMMVDFENELKNVGLGKIIPDEELNKTWAGNYDGIFIM